MTNHIAISGKFTNNQPIDSRDFIAATNSSVKFFLNSFPLVNRKFATSVKVSEYVFFRPIIRFFFLHYRKNDIAKIFQVSLMRSCVLLFLANHSPMNIN